MSTAKPRSISAKQKKVLIAGAVIAALLLYLITAFNGFVNREEDVNREWGRLQSAYQRRIDLVPRLVAVVKASTDYEKQTLQKLAEARAQAAQVQLNPGSADGTNYKKLEEIQAQMAGNMNRVIAIIENYPNLRGDTAFRRLQDQLSGTENRILVARNDFTQTVVQYNKKVRGFPSGMVAGLFGFKKKTGFEADKGAEKAVEVKFNN
ncbi:MAG: LemA family protein [Dinghuibacter sp.]|nr:LemA family protein [Dinghuibacter sp.]